VDLCNKALFGHVSGWVSQASHHQQYLAELIRYYEAPRQLRSRGENNLQNSASVLNFSKRAFCHASPTVWKSLPQTVIFDLTVTTGTFKIGLNLLCMVVLSCSDSWLVHTCDSSLLWM